jgi:hypothetical protein
VDVGEGVGAVGVPPEQEIVTGSRASITVATPLGRCCMRGA